MRTKNRELLVNIEKYVSDCCYDRGCGPTVRETAAEFSMSVGNAQCYLAALKADGKIELGASGRYEPAGFAEETTKLDIVGDISCGPLAESPAENRGSVRLPRSFVGKGEFFLLEANGDSMTNAGIEDGDLVIVKRQPDAEIGDIVVALHENENTLKRLCRDAVGNFFLHPENTNYDDIRLSKIEIQGVAVKVIKDLKR